MYSRVIQGREHTFGVSGRLIMNTLVMYDHQTTTLWAQSLNKGVDGPLAGVDLEFLPVTHTTWGLWLATHPDTVVLDKRGRFPFGSSYESYFRNNTSGIFGEANEDRRLDPKDLVVGVQVNNSFKAYSFEALSEHPVVDDVLGNQGLLVYLSEVDGRRLTFRLLDGGDGFQARLMDNETGSTWMAVTGLAVDGELKGKILDRALAHLSFWFAWKDWNPQTEVYEG